MPEKRTILIVNPAAGYGIGRRIYNKVYDRLKEGIQHIDYKLSESPGLAVEITRKATEDGYEHLIALGGDGTAFEVINGMMKANVRKKPILSFVPAGSGNSFLREFNIDSHELAVERILKGDRRKFDLVHYSYRNGDQFHDAYSLNILGIGFIADVATTRLKYFRFLRKIGYTAGVLLELIRLNRNNIRLVADGVEYDLENNFISLSNSKLTGGRMIMAPEADAQDGKVDIIMLNKAGRMEMLKAFPKIFKGTHIQIDKVTALQAKKIKIDTPQPMNILVDGEVIGTTPIEAEVLKQVLDVII